MNEAKNAAMFWCRLKGYFALFLAFIIGIFFISTLFQINSKDPQKAKHAKQGALITGIMTLFFIGVYFFLKTGIGCGLSIAGNVYQLAR